MIKQNMYYKKYPIAVCKKKKTFLKNIQILVYLCIHSAQIQKNSTALILTVEQSAQSRIHLS